MKIARFSTDGDPRYGIVDDDALVVLAGDPMFSGFDTTGERIPLSGARLLAPVIPRSKVICVARNYAANGSDTTDAGRAAPLLVLKPNTAVIGPGDAIVIPPVEGPVVHEGELVVVIGRIGKQIAAEDWADYVFGYTVGNDVSAQDVMVADGQWSRAKGYDTFAPIGPWIETELDPGDLRIETRVDGELRQSGTTADMIHRIPEIIAFASDVFTLLPGDIIMTGTPAGIGPFGHGQTVDITIDGIGTLTNPARNR